MPGTWADHTMRTPVVASGYRNKGVGWAEGGKRPRAVDRLDIEVAGTAFDTMDGQLQSRSSSLPNYEGVSIALASFCYDVRIDGLGRVKV